MAQIRRLGSNDGVPMLLHTLASIGRYAWSRQFKFSEVCGVRKPAAKARADLREELGGDHSQTRTDL